ncbi:MAG TPA: AAA family ATPase [Thermoanaerobaculia bacterium]|jgi:predicted ATPase|nr:AAA family ATPase [Thermoanaerobaculia bacterium]
MITRVEALGFRCLRHVSQPLDGFHVLVGPNASGKTTFLDVVAFLGDLVSGGLEKAVGDRTANFQDLIWRREGERFELAIEARIPEELRGRLENPALDTVRYEVALRSDPQTREVGFEGESIALQIGATKEEVPPTLLLRYPSPIVIYRAHTSIVTFASETSNQEGQSFSFKLGARRSALANLPEDESKFPVATWLKSLLSEGVQRLVLNSLAIRQASPPGQGRRLGADGSNLPWVVADLERHAPERLREWIGHLQTALPDLETVRTVERADDKHHYLMLGYRGGVEVPSWMASDGTLLLMALTLPAYLPDLSGIFLIEEPENGIHPRAVETMFQSLSSVYGAQILLATHSPVILSLVELEQLLCFSKNPEGATEIVRGSDLPALKEWRGETSLGVLFASGVL